VLNLSIDGVTSMEYMALAARLREEHADVADFRVGSADYRADNSDARGFLSAAPTCRIC
jgi:hypothetical protein